MRPALLGVALLLGALAPAWGQTSDWEADLQAALTAHEAGDDQQAVDMLGTLVDRGAVLFGPADARLVLPLRALSASLANLDRAQDSTLALLRAVRIARSAGPDDLLPALSDLARDRIDAGDHTAAALTGAEIVILDSGDDGTLGEFAQEGAALWALALLRDGHADAALARLLPLLRLDPASLSSDAADLVAMIDEEAGVTDPAEVDAWTNRALADEAARAARDQALLAALAPLDRALAAGDAAAADRAGRLALAQVAIDDPLVTAGTFALLTAHLAAEAPDRALPWALRLAGMPLAYLAGQEIDPTPALEQVTDWALDQGRWTEAVPLAEAIASLTALRAPDRVPLALLRLGSAYRDAGRVPQAQRVLTRALEMLGPAPTPLALRLHTELALVAQDRGDLAGAEDTYRAALALLDGSDLGQDPMAVAFALGEWRGFALAQNRADQALDLSRQAVDRLTALQAGPEAMTPALRNLAADQLAAGDAVAAALTLTQVPPGPRTDALQAAVDAALGRPSRLNLTGAAGLDGLLALIEAAGTLAPTDPATARDLMSGAVAALPPDHPMLAYVLAGRAAITSDPSLALTDLRAATAALTLPDRRDEPQARHHLPLQATLARDLAATSTGPTAQALLDEAFATAQRAADLGAARALSLTTARLQGAGPAATALARQLQEADRALTAARQTHLADLANPRARVALDQARDLRTALVQDLARDFPAYAALADPGPLDLTRTAALLAPDEALLLYATADPAEAGAQARGTIFAVTRDGVLTADLPPRADLMAQARALRCAAALTDPTCGPGAPGTRGAFALTDPEPTQGFDLTLARDLGRVLLDPVAPALRGKARLIIVPDASLAALPFALLLTADTEPDTPLPQAPWLIRNSALTLLPSVASLAALRGAAASAADRPFLGLGDPLIGAAAAGPLPYDCAQPPAMLATALAPERGGITGLAALPETRCELRRAAQAFGTPDAVLLADKASETALKTLSTTGALAQYRVLAFATHGLIAGELGASDAALILTPTPQDDGILTTAEVAALHLDADFVILSACNTAAGSADANESLSGLATAFFLAGSRSLMVSHWPVYSDAATDLTTGMIQTLTAHPNLGRAEALRQAMLAVLDAPQADARRQHPAYWAPFLIIGAE